MGCCSLVNLKIPQFEISDNTNIQYAIDKCDNFYDDINYICYDKSKIDVDNILNSSPDINNIGTDISNLISNQNSEKQTVEQSSKESQETKDSQEVKETKEENESKTQNNVSLLIDGIFNLKAIESISAYRNSIFQKYYSLIKEN